MDTIHMDTHGTDVDFISHQEGAVTVERLDFDMLHRLGGGNQRLNQFLWAPG